MTTSEDAQPRVGQYAYVRPHGRLWGVHLDHEHRGVIVSVDSNTRVSVYFDDVPEHLAEPRQTFHAHEVRVTRAQFPLDHTKNV